MLNDHNWWPQIFTSDMWMICFVSFLKNIFKYTIEIYIHWLGPENKFKKWKTEFLLNLFSGSSKTQKRGKKVHTPRIKIVMFYHGKTIIAIRYTMGHHFFFYLKGLLMFYPTLKTQKCHNVQNINFSTINF